MKRFSCIFCDWKFTKKYLLWLNTWQIFFVGCVIIIRYLLENDKYYFQLVTNRKDISIIKVAFLSFAVALILTHLYIYCYSAERLLTEVKLLCIPNAISLWEIKMTFSEHQYGVWCIWMQVVRYIIQRREEFDVHNISIFNSA